MKATKVLIFILAMFVAVESAAEGSIVASSKKAAEELKSVV